ncbi:MAG TPA: DUF4136 domain-containing protein [Candidatus Baltobacteraceae bacterium]|nr:DUF4136 domain-containing protein [Candidatus Baltobacteraceae bacterium]
MNRIRVGVGKDRLRLFLPLTGLLFVLLWAMAIDAKMATDFNPNLDFTKYKTFAYIGGVESLVRMQLNPEMLNNRIHRAVVRELSAKGLREVQPEENPDLVVRYWVEAESNAQLTGTAHWGMYGSYYYGYWTVMYTTMSTPVTHLGLLGIEMIDAKARELAWRLFVSEKIIHSDPDKIWKTADANIIKAYKSYPPTADAIEKKKAERAKIDAAKKPSQP